MFVEEKREGEPQVLEPSIKNLAFILRHRELWPKDFHWNYSCPANCAMGLAGEMWNCYPTSSSVGQMFGIDWDDAYRIFIGGNPNWFGISRKKPEQIAKALEQLT